MRRIGIMGGTFNPIHIAHLIMAECAREQYGLDKVIFMTSGNPPHKRKNNLTPAEIRHSMVKMAVEENGFFFADDYEIRQKEFSYSVKTMQHLHEIYPDSEIYFIIGGDSLVDLPKWYKPGELLQLCTLLVYPRDTKTDLQSTINEIISIYGGTVLPVTANYIGISSTEIRNRVYEGKSIRYMVPEKVFGYIQENNLYRGDTI